jgi:hypothetical protein
MGANFEGIKNYSSANRATLMDANITIQQDYAQDLPTCPVTNYRALPCDTLWGSRKLVEQSTGIFSKVRIFGRHPSDSNPATQITTLVFELEEKVLAVVQRQAVVK